MNQFVQVLKFELKNYFHNRGYLVTTILISAVLLICLLLPNFISLPFLESDSSGEKESSETGNSMTLGIYDPNGIFEDQGLLTAAFPNSNWKQADDEEALQKLITSDEAEAGFSVSSLNEYTYFVQNRNMTDTKQQTFEALLAQLYRADVLSQNGLGDQTQMLEELYATPVKSDISVLGKDGVENYAYTYLLLFILYMMVIVYGQMIATSITTEKSNRAIEILVTSTTSNSLIFGKVIAGAIASFVQVGVILAAALLAYQATPAWNGMLDFIFNIPAETLLGFAFFGVFGYLFYAFLFGVLGSLVSKTEDVSSSIGSVTLIIVAVFLGTIFTMNDTESIVLKVLSYLPFSSCNAMVARMALSSVPFWEVALSFVILVASTFLTGIFGAKIYRLSTLRYGNPIKLKNALKWLKKSPQ